MFDVGDLKEKARAGLLYDSVNEVEVEQDPHRACSLSLWVWVGVRSQPWGLVKMFFTGLL